MTTIKYLIEHNKSNHWLRYNGDLTNDPNDKGLLTYSDKFVAEEFIKPLKDIWRSDFSGKIKFRCMSQHIRIVMQNSVINKLSQSNIDLFNDFTVTEHMYIND